VPDNDGQTPVYSDTNYFVKICKVISD